MPLNYGFTGQHADATSGLDYFNARYYDPMAGQFISPDSILPGGGYDIFGLSRYAYVEGNPETLIDPSGHCFVVFCAVAAAAGFGVGAVDVAVGLARGSLQVMTDPLGTGLSLAGTTISIGTSVATNPRRAVAGAFAWAAGAVGNLHDRLTTGSWFDRGRAAGQITATIVTLGLPASRLASAARAGVAAEAAPEAETAVYQAVTQGNSFSSLRPTTLYRLNDSNADLLKWVSRAGRIRSRATHRTSWRTSG